MKEFLKTVADHYKKEVKRQDGSMNSLGLADYLFVFPNHRSSLFFNLHLIEGIDQPFFAPNITTISELFSKLSEKNKLKLIDRIELLFLLYEVYVEVSHSNESFDKFLFWGEMILSDFNDVDKYLVDARLLFDNLKDLKQIDEEFFGFEEEQVKIIQTFWRHFIQKPKDGTAKKEFLQMWEVMHTLYEKFRQRLLSMHSAYEGMQQRLLIEELKSMSMTNDSDQERERLERLLGKRVVFVGLTAVSKTEIELMKHLDKLHMADFCWDYADPRLNDRNSHASYFRHSTIETFPNVIDDDELRAGLVPDAQREIEVIEVSSGVGQTVVASNKLNEWKNQGIINPDEKDKSNRTNPFHTAIVLPDEKMLLPMLYSINSVFEPFNVTMGYSLKSTTIASFIDNIALLQGSIQKNAKGETTYYYKYVLPLLNSTYLLNMTDSKAHEIATRIVRNNQYRVLESEFKGNLLLEAVFKQCKSGMECTGYLGDILEILARKAEEELEQRNLAKQHEAESLFGEIEEEARVQGIFSDVEREFLFSFINLLKSFDQKLRKFNWPISCNTFFTLLRKLSQSESVAFSGEPLSGLQVMGVLETRDVDFENLIILSMNEGVFPAKPQTNTFVPLNLRHAFGMPTQQHRDAVFAYHFYRLISRARRVVLIYDSRSEGMQSGEPSRYIKQLTYLHGIEPKNKTVHYDISVEDRKPIEIKKDPHVMGCLDECLSGKGDRKLSATALKYYLSCPLRFYFEFVEGLREEDEIEEGIDDKTFGSILHEVMELIYNKVKARVVSASTIDNVLKDQNYLRGVIEKTISKLMNVDTVTGYLCLVEEILLTYVNDVLKHDKMLCPFEYIASEKRETMVYSASNGSSRKEVQIMAIYDRIDRLSDGTLRIVDYKTGRSTKAGGNSKLSVPAICEIFGEKAADCADEAFQVMLYCLLYNGAKMSPNLYFVRDFHKNPSLNTVLMLGANQPMDNFNLYMKEFKEAFDRLLFEIFDPNISFKQCDDERHCTYCPFKGICKRDGN